MTMEFVAQSVPVPEKHRATPEVKRVAEVAPSVDLTPAANDPAYEAGEQARAADVAAADKLLARIKDGRLGEVEPDFESDPTLVLFERVNNPAIQEQMVDLLLKSEAFKMTEMIEVSEYIFDENDEIVFNDLDAPVKKWVTKLRYPDYVPKIREELMTQIQERVRKVTELGGEKNVAHLYPEGRPDWHESAYGLESDEVYIQSEPFFNTTEPTPRQMAIVLSHEKGHQLRRYNGDTFLDGAFRDLTDWENLAYTPAEIEILKTMRPEDFDGKAEPSPTEHSSSLKEYFDATEILERMSQLKNYFGFRGNETFTLQHLKYAREHYIQDAIDNQMGVFFRVITPEKEAKLIEAMNTYGV